VTTEEFHADRRADSRRTDIIKLILVFLGFARTPKEVAAG